MNKPELLAPAGDLEKLKIAILYGASAVFIGGINFSLRSRASNFTLEDIKEGCDFAHKHNARVHVTTNIVMHNSDLTGLEDYLVSLEKCGVDAIISSSVYILNMAKKLTKMEVHISTQTSAMSSEAVKYYASLKADRVVLGRELSIEELKTIKTNTNTPIEVFIHGGMCVSYSGRCMMSNYMTNRDANRGGCAHSCRWLYDIYDENNLRINDSDKPFAMSSKDLCAISCIKDLMDLNIDSFKIEGRMKSLHYIATVVKAYRNIIDEYYNTSNIVDCNKYITDINKAENRLTSTGFLLGEPTINEQLYDLNLTVPTKEFVGIVLDYDSVTHMCYCEQRNYFLPFSKLEVFGPTKDFIVSIKEIYDELGNEIDAARHPLMKVSFYLDQEVSKYDMLRLVK